MPNNWYKDNIEPGVRDLVRHLRNSGVNTECSCEGHKAGDEPYIQCQLIPDGELQTIHNLIFNWLVDNKTPANYEIIIRHVVENGHSRTTLDIRFPKLPKDR